MARTRTRGPLLSSIIMVMLATAATGLLAMIGFQAIPETVIPSTFGGGEHETRRVDVTETPAVDGSKKVAPTPTAGPPTPGTTKGEAEPAHRPADRGTTPTSTKTAASTRGGGSTPAKAGTKPPKTPSQPTPTTSPTPTHSPTPSHSPSPSPCVKHGHSPKCHAADGFTPYAAPVSDDGKRDAQADRKADRQAEHKAGDNGQDHGRQGRARSHHR